MKNLLKYIATFFVACFAFVIGGMVGDFVFYHYQSVWTSGGAFGVSFLGIFTSGLIPFNKVS